MMHLRSLVLFLFLFPGDARRTTDDSSDYAQQQDNMFANRLEVSADTREAFIPPGPRISHRAGPQAGAWREGSKQDVQRAGNIEPHRGASLFPSMPHRAKVTLQAANAAADKRALVAETAKGSRGDLQKKKVLVIGAGIGGLVTAGLLAQRGDYNVTVLEKNTEDMIGGRINQEFIAGIRFDLGPSLLLLPDVYRRTFRELGLDFDAEVKVERVAPTYKAYFEDGTSLVLDPRDPGFREALEDIEAGSFEQFKEYMRSAEINLEGGWPNFIEEDIQLGVLPKFLGNALSLKNWPLQSHAASLQQYFKSPKLQALFSFQDLYVGLSPYNAPAVFSLLTAIELSGGVYYPLGGFQQIPRVLRRRCEELGVNFRFDAAVTKILGTEAADKKSVVEGVQLADGSLMEGDIVVANPDLPYVEENLIPQGMERDLKRCEYSTPTVSFYFAMDKQFDALAHHTICLSTDYVRSWDVVKDEGEFPVRFNFYVHAPSRTDPSVIPAASGSGGGGDSIMVLVPTPPLPTGLSDAETKVISDKWVAQAREGLLKRFAGMPGMSDFEKHIKGEKVRTPYEWRYLYNLNRGAVFGLSGKLSQLSLLRPDPRHPSFENLYFVGASTRPGNGVPLVMTGARLVANRIAREQQEKASSQ